MKTFQCEDLSVWRLSIFSFANKQKIECFRFFCVCSSDSSKSSRNHFAGWLFACCGALVFVPAAYVGQPHNVRVIRLWYLLPPIVEAFDERVLGRREFLMARGIRWWTFQSHTEDRLMMKITEHFKPIARTVWRERERERLRFLFAGHTIMCQTPLLDRAFFQLSFQAIQSETNSVTLANDLLQWLRRWSRLYNQVKWAKECTVFWSFFDCLFWPFRLAILVTHLLSCSTLLHF